MSCLIALYPHIATHCFCRRRVVVLSSSSFLSCCVPTHGVDIVRLRHRHCDVFASFSSSSSCVVVFVLVVILLLRSRRSSRVVSHCIPLHRIVVVARHDIVFITSSPVHHRPRVVWRRVTLRRVVPLSSLLSSLLSSHRRVAIDGIASRHVIVVIAHRHHRVVTLSLPSSLHGVASHHVVAYCHHRHHVVVLVSKCHVTSRRRAL